jgi:hypothetical protein
VQAGEVDDGVLPVLGVVELGVKALREGEERLPGPGVLIGGLLLLAREGASNGGRARNRRPNTIMAVNTPRPTPMARLQAATVATTVTPITVLSNFGIICSPGWATTIPARSTRSRPTAAIRMKSHHTMANLT